MFVVKTNVIWWSQPRVWCCSQAKRMYNFFDCFYFYNLFWFKQL